MHVVQEPGFHFHPFYGAVNKPISQTKRVEAWAGRQSLYRQKATNASTKEPKLKLDEFTKGVEMA
jgi:hypothetical protein